MPGPPRKPLALRKMEGNRGHRARVREPQPEMGEPNPPSWIPREARAEWRRVVPALDRIGMLSKVDRAALTSYCLAWSRMRNAQADIDERGLFVTSIRGAECANPAVAVQKEAAQQVMRFAAEFGLTPAARARLATPEAPKTENPLMQLIAAKRGGQV